MGAQKEFYSKGKRKGLHKWSGGAGAIAGAAAMGGAGLMESMIIAKTGSKIHK